MEREREREHERVLLEKTEQNFFILIDSIAPLKKYKEKSPIMCAFFFRLLILVKCLQITTSSLSLFLSYSPLHPFLWFFHHRYAAHTQKFHLYKEITHRNSTTLACIMFCTYIGPDEGESLSLSFSFRSFLFFENPFLNVDCGTFTFNPNVNYSLGCASTFVVVVVVATRQVKVWAEHIIFESVLSLQKKHDKTNKNWTTNVR
jgi:hypothetical protein